MFLLTINFFKEWMPLIYYNYSFVKVNFLWTPHGEVFMNFYSEEFHHLCIYTVNVLCISKHIQLFCSKTCIIKNLESIFNHRKMGINDLKIIHDSVIKITQIVLIPVTAITYLRHFNLFQTVYH